MTSKITIELLKEYLKMNNIIKLTDKAERTERTANKYRLDEINKIRDYFDNEIKNRKYIIKKLNKYLVSFDYLDNINYFISIIWYFKYSFTSYSNRYTSWCYRCFFDFNIYNRYGHKQIISKSY